MRPRKTIAWKERERNARIRMHEEEKLAATLQGILAPTTAQLATIRVQMAEFRAAPEDPRLTACKILGIDPMDLPEPHRSVCLAAMQQQASRHVPPEAS